MESNSRLNKTRAIFKNLGIYMFAAICCFSSAYLGYWYSQKMEKKESEKKVTTKIKNSQINLAVDQNNNLIVIDKTTGDYIIYEDTVGVTIFSLYAKNLWATQ